MPLTKVTKAKVRGGVERQELEGGGGGGAQYDNQARISGGRLWNLNGDQVVRGYDRGKQVVGLTVRRQVFAGIWQLGFPYEYVIFIIDLQLWIIVGRSIVHRVPKQLSVTVVDIEAVVGERSELAIHKQKTGAAAAVEAAMLRTNV